MKGKNKCKILKDIRKAIAKENDIEYVTSECKYQGDCSGTCPKCESEVRYLEAELEKRRVAGKSVALAGIAASMILSSGCGSSGNGIFAEKTMGDMAVSEYSSFESEPNSLTSEIGLVDGQIQPPSKSSEEVTATMGDIPDITEEIMGEEIPDITEEITGKIPDVTMEITGEVPDVTMELMGVVLPPDFSEESFEDLESESAE